MRKHTNYIHFLLFSGLVLSVLACISPGKNPGNTDTDNPSYADYTGKPVFSAAHGIYEKSFTLEVSSETPGAFISYTLDCSDPTDSKSVKTGKSPVIVTIDPDNNPNGKVPAVVLRAYAHKDGLGPSTSVTQTYLFLNRITELSPDEKRPGKLWPAQNKYSATHQQIDYGLDPKVYNAPEYADNCEAAFLQIPVLSLVADHDAFFHTRTGIYVNPRYHGKKWERPGSLELLDNDGGFRINCGIRIRGGASRNLNFPKHAFRLFFRNQYEKGKLAYPLFEDEGTDSFDKIDLRTSMNYSWANKQYTSAYNTFLRDIFARDLQRDMGQPYTRSRFYHLFLNGCYWGLYQTQERPEARYAASYFGGEVRDYDVVKVDIGHDGELYEIEATDGNLDAWREIYELTNTGYAFDKNYYKLLGRNPRGERDPSLKVMVEIDNLIDFMIIIFYTGNFDSPICKFRGDLDPNNFYALYNRVDDNKGFVFLVHDAEHGMFVDEVAVGSGLHENRVNCKRNSVSFLKFTPQDLHNGLAVNETYRQRFDQRVKKHFFNDGPLTYENNSKRLRFRMNQIDMAIIAESARWGDAKRPAPRTKADWEWAVNQLLYNYFPKRTAIVLRQLQSAGLYNP